MSKRKDIQNNGLSQEKLLAYMEGKLSADEQREVEALLSEEGMESDALEGLTELSAGNAKQLTNRIDYTLLHELKKNQHKGRKKLGADMWTWIALFVIILLTFIAYLIVTAAIKQ